MWGLRAGWAIVVVVGVLVPLSGCQHNLHGIPLMPGDGGALAPRDLASQEEPAGSGAIEGDWRRGGGWFKDAPERLTPERIEGGIY